MAIFGVVMPQKVQSQAKHREVNDGIEGAHQRDRAVRRIAASTEETTISATVTTTISQSPVTETASKMARIRGRPASARQRLTTRPAIKTNAIPRAIVAIRNGWKTVTCTACRFSMRTQAKARPPAITASTVTRRTRAAGEPKLTCVLVAAIGPGIAICFQNPDCQSRRARYEKHASHCGIRQRCGSMCWGL